MALTPIPLTIVTGFLGSGKSTFVRHCIDVLGNEGLKVALIQNEMVDGGMEDVVVTGDDGKIFEDFMELANGCVCCTVKNDFISALQELLRRKRFDYVLVECSGAADPGPLASMFWVDEELEIGVYLDGILCVVDAKNFDTLIKSDQGSNLERQILFSDRILLNKIDLVDNSFINATMDHINAMKYQADVYKTCHSVVSDLKELLWIEAYRANETNASLAAVNSDKLKITKDHCHRLLNSVVLESRRSLPSIEALKSWLATLLWEDESGNFAKQIYRMKGIFSIPDLEEKVFLQGVCELFDLDISPSKWDVEENRYCKVIIIGSGLETHLIQQSFEQLFPPDV